MLLALNDLILSGPPAGIDWRSLKDLQTRGNLPVLQTKWSVLVKQVVREELVDNRETILYKALANVTLDFPPQPCRTMHCGQDQQFLGIAWYIHLR